jgi:hypothetical protein
MGGKPGRVVSHSQSRLRQEQGPEHKVQQLLKELQKVPAGGHRGRDWMVSELTPSPGTGNGLPPLLRSMGTQTKRPGWCGAPPAVTCPPSLETKEWLTNRSRGQHAVWGGLEVTQG